MNDFNLKPFFHLLFYNRDIESKELQSSKLPALTIIQEIMASAPLYRPLNIPNETNPHDFP
jgi:hypothetical protein